jgi:hypothetical protein
MDTEYVGQLVEILALQAQNMDMSGDVHEWFSFRGMCASSNRGALITKAPGEEKSTLDTLGSFLIGGGRVGVNGAHVSLLPRSLGCQQGTFFFLSLPLLSAPCILCIVAVKEGRLW